MTIAATYSPGPNVEDVTIEKDGGILKEILVRWFLVKYSRVAISVLK